MMILTVIVKKAFVCYSGVVESSVNIKVRYIHLILS